MYSITSATRKIAALRKRIRAVQGGTSASKTVSIIIGLIELAQKDESPTLTSIVSESFPHLKKGAIRDFLSIMQEHQYFKDSRWNKTDSIYTFETGSKIEFFSVDQPGKVRGPRRDRLFINEANNIPYETFDQLEVRTNEFVFLDFNPVSEFWLHTEVLGKRDDVDHIILTYLDNEALDANVVRAIEQRRENKNWWKVYGEGQLGELVGRIYIGWPAIDEIPHQARFIRYGLNFGYSNHPMALVAIYHYDGGFIIDELGYGLGVKNRQIADMVKNQPEPQALVMADSAEPKSVDEIKEYGVNITGVPKGADSVRQGINYVQDQRISITKRSVNVIKEYRNYMWAVDRRTGQRLNEPEEPFHYSMDAVRYGIVGLMPPDLRQEVQQQRQIEETRREAINAQAQDAGL